MTLYHDGWVYFVNGTKTNNEDSLEGSTIQAGIYRVKADEEGNIPDAPEPVRLAVILMTSFYYENRDIPDMTTYKATRMAFDNLLYRYRDPEKMF